VAQLIAVIVEQYGYDDYLKFYDLDGNLQNSYLLGNGIVYFETDCMAMDTANNVYYIKNSNYLTKIDSGGNELLSTEIASYAESIAIGSDGYLYTREGDGEIHKRSLSDFSSQSYITLTSGKNYSGLVLDENNNIFTVNTTDDQIEKWSSAGVKTAYRSVADSGLSSLCLAPNEDYILRLRNKYNGEVFIIKKDLSANESNYTLTSRVDAYPHATSSVGSMYLFTGEDINDDNNCMLEVHKWGSVEWYVTVDDSQYSPNNSLVAAYPFSYITITTLAPTLVEDGIANLRLELVDKAGLTINPVGWYCDENAAPSTEYIETGWRGGIGGIDLALGEYSKYVKTLAAGHSTMYVQAWCDDDASNRYTGEILSYEIPTEPEYLVLPDIEFPELPELPEFDYPEYEFEMPDINYNLDLDLYLDRTYTRKDLEELRQKCINYEKNYTDYCLVLNHSTLLVKNFLQSVYNNGELAGESEMFAKVYPSQQLTPLYLEPLQPNDFKGIINRFVNNNTSNSMGLNHNFDLFTEWLNDYNYTSDGYKASHITQEENVITNNEPTVKYMKRKVDKLQKEVSTSSRGIAHNFNLLKEIIQ